MSHLGDATEALIECRRVLKSTYPFAFYLKPGPEKVLFENLQGRLEGQCELLSGALERSNVDIAEELVGLITAQRNFQANAKAIDTATQISQTVINLRT